MTHRVLTLIRGFGDCVEFFTLVVGADPNKLEKVVNQEMVKPNSWIGTCLSDQLDELFEYVNGYKQTASQLDPPPTLQRVVLLQSALDSITPSTWDIIKKFLGATVEIEGSPSTASILLVSDPSASIAPTALQPFQAGASAS